MAKWTVDQSHSLVGFEVKHMMVSKVKGQFESYTADVEAEDLTNLTTAQIAFSFDVASINTRNEDRDNHLKSADFFDVENNSTIDFKSTSIIVNGEDYKVTGDLTIKGVTKQVTFDVEFGGKGTNPWGVEVYGFEAEAKINREEFGLTWNAALETGGVLVGKEIKIKVELEINPAA
ncbi:polyisoprenoid-binding protein YceI [Cytobacillus eiseniae]|uniref:Polyisoprenoid-binding protein YceI n=1 Tax=Cytobacillus eiseniae TaxID=762947 RepID=A0ABS4RBJ0_9BACI|nr:YceI family protein [Cytobacillus eiseniae]MBP2239756.1 polyisoprenoid-binding protein YceI [Cytobacillus eiseniae]